MTQNSRVVSLDWEDIMVENLVFAWVIKFAKMKVCGVCYVRYLWFKCYPIYFRSLHHITHIKTFCAQY